MGTDMKSELELMKSNQKFQERLHKDNLKFQKQSNNLTKWFLLATILIGLSSTLPYLEEVGFDKSGMTIVYLFIGIIIISLFIKVIIIIFKKE